VQSFHLDELRRMERIHTPDEVVQGVEWARAAGFVNLNLDLIFALPQQTLERWEASLQRSIALQPEHSVAVRADAGAEHTLLPPVPEGQAAPARR
jgi:oxygen-independent coproporphyrinogen-3 oxidase